MPFFALFVVARIFKMRHGEPPQELGGLIPRSYNRLLEEQAKKPPPITSFLSLVPDLTGVSALKNVADYLPLIQGHTREGRFDEAQRYLYVGIRHSYFIGNLMAVERYLVLLAYLEQARGNMRRELEAWLGVVDIMESRGRETSIAEILPQLARLYLFLGEQEAAKAAIDRMEGFRRWENNLHGLPTAYNFIGDSFQLLGDRLRAQDWLERSLKIQLEETVWNPDFRDPDGIRKRHRRNPEILRDTYLRLADLAMERGETRQAREYLRLAEAPSPEIAYIERLIRLKDFRALNSKLAQVEAQLRASPPAPSDIEGVLRSHRLLSTLYLALGRPGDALPRLDDALKAQKDLERAYTVGLEEDRRRYREEINRGSLDYNIWNAYFRIDVRDPTVSSYRIHLLIAQAHELRSDWTAAIAAQKEAIAAWPGFSFWFSPFVKQGDNVREQGPGLWVDLARLQRRAGLRSQAKESLGLAIDGVAKMLSQPDRVRVLDQIAREWAALGEAQERRKTVETAIAIYEGLLARVADPTQALLFPDLNAGGLYKALAEIASAERKPAIEVLAQIERGKSQAMGFLLAQSRGDVADLLPPNEAQPFKALRREMQIAGADFRWVSVNDQRGNYKKFKARYEELAQQFVQREAVLRSRFPFFSSSIAPVPPTPEALRKLARAHPDTLYLCYSIDESSGSVIALCDQVGARAFPIEVSGLSKLCGAWRAALRQPTILAQQEESRLSLLVGERLWEPVRAGGIPPSIRRIVFIPDGPLHGLPLAAMKVSRTARLIERWPISYALSLSALMMPRPKRPAPQRAMFCLADPALGTGDRVQASDRRKFGVLRYAREEARAVATLFPGSLALFGPDATESRVRLALPTSRILHFATHGVADSKNGLRSWLLLAGDRSGEFDGRLEAGEIARLPLCTSLAVLSACDSGLGQAESQEGILGFAWAFHVAGCASVVGSLWAIDDRATARFMPRFYKYLQEGMETDRALQGAMVAFLRDRSVAAPYYWASFVLSGDPSKLPC